MCGKDFRSDATFAEGLMSLAEGFTSLTNDFTSSTEIRIGSSLNKLSSYKDRSKNLLAKAFSSLFYFIIISCGPEQLLTATSEVWYGFFNGRKKFFFQD